MVTYYHQYKGIPPSANNHVHHLGSSNIIEDTINQFVRKNVPTITLGYTKLAQMKEESLKNCDFIENSKVSTNLKNELNQRVNSVLIKIEECLKKLNDEVAEIYDAIYNISTIDQCESFFIKVKQILNKEIREEDREGIEEAANHLQNFLNDIQPINQVKENRGKLLVEMKALDDKWSEIESEIDFSVILTSQQKFLVDRLDELSRRWELNYVFSEEVINSWSVKECTTWIVLSF